MQKSKKKGWAAVFLSVGVIALAILALYMIGKY